MILNLIKFGIKALLKTICEDINIKSIQIFNKNNKFSGEIDKLFIKAENIIYNKIYVNELIIYIQNIIINIDLITRNLVLNNCFAEIKLRLRKEDIKNILLSNKWSKLRATIETFSSIKNINNVGFKDNYIFFNSIENNYSLKSRKNNILLQNNINKNILEIPIDKNINIKELLICKDYIEIDLYTKLIFKA